MKKVLCTLLGMFFSGMVSAETLLDASGRPVRFAGKFGNQPVIIRDVPARHGEFRGIWVATVENIDFPEHKSAWAFQKDFRALADNVKAAGFTAIIFQIRSNCDAFYPTNLAPWSRWMTGKEDANLGKFDPLAFMVEETHRRGLEFHAWFNPYRVVGSTRMSKDEYLSTLSWKNFARRNPGCVLTKSSSAGNRLFLDPGMPQVVEHLAAVVEDVVRRYKIDAVHFDDYFYPYERLGNEDAATFRRYNPHKLSLEEWRRSNTENLIRRIDSVIHAVNVAQRRNVRFGVSPFGIWANIKTKRNGSRTGGMESYSAIFADTYKWVRRGYIDYIAPQIYWSFDNDVAAYAELVSWWSSVVRGSRVKLYIGIAAYNGGKWQRNELINQVRFNRMNQNVSGAAFFSYRSFFGSGRNNASVALLRFLRTGGR